MNNDAASPCSIRIFLRDGRPDGIRSAEKTMSTTQAIAFPHSARKEAEAAFPDTLDRPGVYILLDADDTKIFGREAYIGESEGVSDRLKFHASQHRKKKAFWDDTIVLVSKDENLTKSACAICRVTAHRGGSAQSTLVPARERQDPFEGCWPAPTGRQVRHGQVRRRSEDANRRLGMRSVQLRLGDTGWRRENWSRGGRLGN